MARMPAYVWDIGLALALFLLYLELKNINLVSNEEKQLWQDYYERQKKQQQQQQGAQHGGILDSIGGAIGGFFDAVGNIGNMGASSGGPYTQA